MNGSLPNDPISTLRLQAWLRARGELQAMMATFTDARFTEEEKVGVSVGALTSGFVRDVDRALGIPGAPVNGSTVAGQSMPPAADREAGA